jgi:UDP-glucose 4-epimerase
VICVTGHLGFVGTHLLDRLPLAEILGIDLQDGFDILDCDLPDADVVIHLAAQPGVISSMDNPELTMWTNVQGTVRLAERYKDARFVFASSGGAIQETIASPYGLSKKMGEDYLRLRHPDAVILRFSNVYGPGSRSVVDRFLSVPEITIYGDGSQTRTFVHVDDLCDGIMEALEWPAGTYSFGGDTVSVGELAEATDRPVTYEPWRAGELVHSSVPNHTRGWFPERNVLDYVLEQSCLRSRS